MKRFVMLVVLAVAAVSGVFAQVTVAGQTYFYKFVEKVDAKTGARSKPFESWYKITFANNSCVITSRSGEQLAPNPYEGEKNNTYVYRRNISSGVYSTAIFSKDYKRLDWNVGSADSDVDIYVQAEPVTLTALIPATNLATLPRPASSVAQNKPSAPAPAAQPSQTANKGGNGKVPCSLCKGTGDIFNEVELYGGFKTKIRLTCWRCNGSTEEGVVWQAPPPIGGSSSSSSGSSSSPGSPSRPINDSSISSGTYDSTYRSLGNAVSSAISRYNSATTASDKNRVLSDIRSQQARMRQFRMEASGKGVNISADFYETWSP